MQLHFLGKWHMENFSVKQRVPWNITGVGIKHPKKFFTKPMRFRIIPDIPTDGIIFDFGKKAQGIRHFLFSILVLSSSRDKRDPGADSYRLNLLSISAL